jgi:hypothetical protein
MRWPRFSGPNFGPQNLEQLEQALDRILASPNAAQSPHVPPLMPKHTSPMLPIVNRTFNRRQQLAYSAQLCIIATKSYTKFRPASQCRFAPFAQRHGLGLHMEQGAVARNSKPRLCHDSATSQSPTLQHATQDAAPRLAG